MSLLSGETTMYVQSMSQLKLPCSIVSKIQTGDLRVVPIIAVDLSMANLTFDERINLHSS